MNRKEKALELSDAYNITITGRHLDITQSMKDYAIEKVSQVEKFSDRIIDINVSMDVQKLDHKVDITMKMNNLKIRSSASTPDMYVSIDEAVKKLQTQLLKYKNKIQNHHTKGIKSVELAVNVIEPHLEDEFEMMNDEIENLNGEDLLKKYQPHKVVSKHSKQVKVLSLDEAIMKMELSKDNFLLYRCEEDQNVKLIYRREDGNYGQIEVKL